MSGRKEGRKDGRKEGRSDREEGLKKIEREEIVREGEISCCKWIKERNVDRI